MIRIEGLRKRYGEQVVLDGLDLEVSHGQRVALLGPNGAGKTTLFRCILGIVGFGGGIRIDGHRVREEGKRARGRVGYVPQTAPAYQMSLRAFLELFSDLRGIPVEGAARRLEELGLSLAEAGGKSLRELSGGMLQKAVLALALASEAPVLLLDEPTASLDPASRREFLRGVREVDVDRTLLFASHRYDEIESLADRVLVLHRGGFVFDGTPTELRERTELGSLLWLRVPEDARERAAGALREDPAVRSLRSDGAGLAADVEPAAVVELLARLRERGVEIREVRARPPAPEEMMTRVLERTAPGEEGAT
jgi:ABC-type multidrug transport system ATPase subunit